MQPPTLRRHAPLVVVLAALTTPGAIAVQPVERHAATDHDPMTSAQLAFYNARYAEAAALALSARDRGGQADLATFELRSSALLFQLRRAVGEPKDRRRVLDSCTPCPGLIEDFANEFEQGRSLARARVADHPSDDEALFFLGKLNLNYLWLQLGTLGRRTGWHEYWEARRSLDRLLERDPGHVRGRVARAWVDYIVDTRMPRGTKWLLGGGNRRRALAYVRDAAEAEADFFARAEAAFALWDMERRERHAPEALDVATRLAREFPENQELQDFVRRGGAPLTKRD